MLDSHVLGITDQTAWSCTYSRQKNCLSCDGRIGLNHKPKRKPDGITKADKEALTSDVLMNSAGGRCHDNARCESMWARFQRRIIL